MSRFQSFLYRAAVVWAACFFAAFVFALETPAAPRGGELRVEGAAGGEASFSVPLAESRNAQDHIQFQVEAPENARASLVLSLRARVGGEEREVHSEAVEIRGPRAVDLNVGDAFQLQDATYAVSRLGFALRAGAPVAVRVRDLRLGATDELTAAKSDYVVESAWTPPPPRAVAGLRPVRVWFDFDNTDRDTTIRAFPKRDQLPDPNPSGGFATLLLENADGIVELAAAPDAADVIVYARARAGGLPDAPALLAAGKRFVVYGPCPDPDLARLLPLEFEERALDDFAPRETVEVLAPGHVLLGGEAPVATDYGRYFSVSKRAGRTLLAFAPSGEPMLAEDGGVLHFAIGVGVRVLPAGDVFFDRTLLRAICLNEPAALAALAVREREEAQAAARKEKELLERILGADGAGGAGAAGWRVGMSEENFGRFGWLVGEGLLCGQIGRDLTVRNGPQHFRVDPSDAVSAALHDWRHRVVEGTATFAKSTPANTDPVEVWNGVGVVEYTAGVVFDPAWRGRRFVFEVENGIDDTDVTHFNGEIIGQTGEDVPRHYQARRAYPIPDAAIRWGEVNEFRVRVTNLRGGAGFNSAPRVVSADSAASAGVLRVAETDWVHKKYEIDAPEGRRELWMSLLSPFVLNRLPQSETRIALEEKTAQYAAFSTAAGIRVRRLDENPGFYDRDRDGELNAPWVLLFRKNWERARPLLLVFEKPVRSLAAILNGRFVSGLKIAGDGPLGFVAAGWPFGSTPVDASDWVDGLPPQAIERIRSSLDLALNYPVGCDEAYRLDRENGRVEIVNRFRYLRINDHWNTPVRALATLPPLVAFLAEKGRYVLETDPVENIGPDTDYGPLRGIAGSGRIAYALPIAPDDDLAIAGVDADAELNRTLNRLFAEGNRWSRGGSVRREEFTPAYPEGEKRFPEVKSLGLYTWNFGLSVGAQGYGVLSPENRQALRSRIRERFFLPLEQYQHKAVYRDRIEPFTGLRYPILFNHSHPNSTRYAPGIGSPVIFGDNNESCTMVAWLGQQCADLLGAPAPAANAWNFVRYAMRNSIVLDDYLWHANACREFGSGAFIDMLNGEYAGFVQYARLARAVGDRATENEARYRAAKRGVSTLARLFFMEYIERALPHVPLKGAAVCTGFSETGFPLMRLPSNDHNFRVANELFDFAQGSPGPLFRLYDRHARPQIEAYLHDHAFPALFKDGLMGQGYLTPMLLYARAGVPVREQVEALLERDAPRLGRDWPGIRMAYQGGLLPWRENGRVGLRRFRGIELREARYDPAAKTLRLVFAARAHTDAELAVEADFAPHALTHNGVAVDVAPRFDAAGKILSLPVWPGHNEILVEYE